MVFLFIFKSSFVVYFVIKEKAENGVLELRVGEGKMGTFAWDFAMLDVGVFKVEAKDQPWDTRRILWGCSLPRGRGANPSLVL